MKIADGRVEYEGIGFSSGRKCACHIQVWQKQDYNVVIATELHESPGVSVTNSCELWAAEICREHLLDPLKTHFIEHYDRRGGQIDPYFPPETFDRITFKWSDARSYKELDQPLHAGAPNWKPMKKEQVEDLIGEKLP